MTDLGQLNTNLKQRIEIEGQTRLGIWLNYKSVRAKEKADFSAHSILLWQYQGPKREVGLYMT